jgi:drug/metabolite transporter (DMT)-like permease
LSEPRLHLLLPLASSLLYVLGAVLLKRATAAGVGLWRAAFVTNLVSAVAFLPLLALGGPGQVWTAIWQPAVVALLLVAGQCSSLWALTRGDVSVATPVLGAKIILVAFFTTVVAGQRVPPQLWWAAILGTLAIGLLNRGPAGRHHDLMLTILGSLLAAVAFALFDVLVMLWSPAWGAGRFLPLMMGLAGLYSLAFIPLFSEPLRKVPRTIGWILLGGAVLVALQGILLITTIAVFGDATSVNIVYGTRGLWSVLLVWLAGRWLGSEEFDRGAGVLGGRLAGALLMTAAVVVVFR